MTNKQLNVLKLQEFINSKAITDAQKVEVLTEVNKELKQSISKRATIKRAVAVTTAGVTAGIITSVVKNKSKAFEAKELTKRITAAILISTASELKTRNEIKERIEIIEQFIYELETRMKGIINVVEINIS